MLVPLSLVLLLSGDIDIRPSVSTVRGSHLVDLQEHSVRAMNYILCIILFLSIPHEKHQKMRDFMMFSGGIERYQW